MTAPISRRSFLFQSAVLAGPLSARPARAAKPPGDYIVVEGHRDIWELSDRFRIRDRKQHSPMRDFLVPRLIEGGVSVVIMPAGGDSVEERDGNQPLFEGSMRTLDMILLRSRRRTVKPRSSKPRGISPRRRTATGCSYFSTWKEAVRSKSFQSRIITPIAGCRCCASSSGSVYEACSLRITDEISSAMESRAARWAGGYRRSESRWFRK